MAAQPCDRNAPFCRYQETRAKSGDRREVKRDRKAWPTPRSIHDARFEPSHSAVQRRRLMSGCSSGSFVIEAPSLAGPLSGETRSRTAFGAKTGTRELIVPASLLWKNTCWIGAECRIISSIKSPSRALTARRCRPKPLPAPSPHRRDHRDRHRNFQFFSTRQLSPTAFSVLHTPAAAFIDTKGPIEAW